MSQQVSDSEITDPVRAIESLAEVALDFQDRAAELAGGAPYGSYARRAAKRKRREGRA